ncbi:MAG: DUF1559 domain-containing protein [Planctomycetota bacterium]
MIALRFLGLRQVLVVAMLGLGMVAGVSSWAQTGGGTAEATKPFDAAARVAAVASLIDDQTLAIAHADVRKVDLTALLKFVQTNVPKTVLDENRTQAMQQGFAIAGPIREQLLATGASEWYAVARMNTAAAAPAPGGPPANPALLAIVAVIEKGKDPQAAAALLGQLIPLPARVQGQMLIFTPPNEADAWKGIKPRANEAYEAGFRAAGNTALQLVFVPNQFIKETELPLPPGGELIAPVVRSMQQKLQWAALTMNAPADTALALLVKMADKESAELIQSTAKLGLDTLRKQPQLRSQFPNLDEIVEVFTPKLRGEDLLRVVLTEKNGGLKVIIDGLSQGMVGAQGAANRVQGINNLKQLALAMHNFHDAYRTFPGQATIAADGKKLLSWRVHLLPFLEQGELYKQFRLNEPWDSEHNKALIGKMPATFKSPRSTAEMAAQGLTTYVAPIAKGTIMGDDKPNSMSAILDGTSNTILFVDALPEKAVIWTKPDDLPVDEKAPFAGLIGKDDVGFTAALADGSVLELKAQLDPVILWNLFIMADGRNVGNFRAQ